MHWRWWMYQQRPERQRQGETRHGWRACNYKEGKAFPVLFDDLTSHYPISHACSHLARRSATKESAAAAPAQEEWDERSSMHCTLHTACQYFLFSLDIAVLHFWFLKFLPPYTFPADCRVGLPEHVRGHRGFFSIPRRPYQSRAWDPGKATYSLLLGVAVAEMRDRRWYDQSQADLTFPSISMDLIFSVRDDKIRQYMPLYRWEEFSSIYIN